MQKTKPYNDIDLNLWRDYGHIKTDSLWIIDKGNMVDKNFHGAFVPEVGRQLVERYSKEGSVVLDLFIGSGTTINVCQELNRKVIGVDLDSEKIVSLRDKFTEDVNTNLICFNSADIELTNIVKQINSKKNDQELVDLVILHPPYWDIIKFSSNPDDLSNAKTIDAFRDMMTGVANNAYSLLKPGCFACLVIGNCYANSEVVPLNQICSDVLRDKGFKFKAEIVKNMSGNEKAKGKDANLWRYRALAGGFNIFKHEYVMIFQKKR